MLVLVLGGARSGKSEVAERRVSSLPAPVTYVATITVGEDPEMAERVAVHRARRPADWATVEAGPDLASTVAGLPGTVLVDALGPWVASVPDFAVDTDALSQALLRRSGDTVVVSEEVGMGVHPSSEVGRHFRDALGLVNQAVAAVADEALLVVAGRILRLS